MPQSALLGIPHLARWPVGVPSVNTEKDPKGHESTRIRALFLFSEYKELKQDWETSRRKVRTMSVLFSELLIPGWAEDGSKTGLGDVTGAYGSDIAFNLPCHTADPELFFSEKSNEINVAKSLCGACPVRQQCLDAALSRQEPCGVWGGELFEDGVVIARKRTVGRPRLEPAAVITEIEEVVPALEISVVAVESKEESDAA